MSVMDAAMIRRKTHIPEDVRTDGKDDAADIIQRVIDAGEWPVELTELADRTDWSRSHYRNTLRDYFEPVETDASDDTVMKISVPEEMDRVSYLQGWIDGHSAATNQ